MPTLFIRALSQAEPSADGYTFAGEWLILEDDGTEKSSGVADYRGLQDLLDPGFDWAQNPDNVVVVVPSEFVLGVSCSVPGRNVGQIRKALPFAVEEFVASDIEGMHLAHGVIQRDRPVRCNLVERDILSAWRDCFAALAATPGTIVSEAELLPDETDVAYALLDGDQVLIKTADQAATVDRFNIGFALQSLAASRLRIVNGALSDEERSAILSDTELTIESEVSASDSTIGYLANSFRTNRERVINLLQGEFTPKRPQQQSYLRWRSVAALAAAWFGVALLLSVAQAYWSAREAERLSADGLAQYQALFPNDKRATATSWRRRLQNKLQPTGGDGPSVSLLSYISGLSGVVDQSVKLNGMNFNGERSELSVDVLTPDFNRLDRVKGALEGQGYAVEVLSAQQQDDDKVRARLRLQSAAG